MTSTSSEDVSLIRLAAKRLQKITINPELREKTILTILDYLGAISSGLKAPWAENVIKYGRTQQGRPEAHAWGLQEKASAKTAAFVNAFLAHSAIRDDMHLKSNSHIGSMVISAALALAQRDEWSGEQLLRGIIGGYEMASILGTAVQQSPGYNRHARPSGICGALGAAGAAIAATNPSEDVAVNALAFAANMASGFNEWAWAGGTEIYQEMGSASQAGIDAFELARAGLKCSETVLEGRAGLFAALNATQGADIFRRCLAMDIGQGILDVRFKPVPGCNYAQTPLAAALKLGRESDLSQGIEQVWINCTSGAMNYPGCNNLGPYTNVQQTKMSIQYGVCAVLLHGSVSEELFMKYDSKEINALVKHTTLECDPEFEEDFKAGRQPAFVKIQLQNNNCYHEKLSDVPWLDAESVRSRFAEETKDLLGQDRSAKLAATVENVRDMKDLSSLWEMFTR